MPDVIQYGPDTLRVLQGDAIVYEQAQRHGPIPRTMAELEKENAELRQWLKILWQTAQSHGAYLIQQGQGLEKLAVSIASGLDASGQS